MNISPLYSRIGCVTDLFPNGTRLYDTGVLPEHRRNRHRTSHRHRNAKPRLFNKRIILWVAGKCCRNVTAVRYDRRARRAERVGRSFVGIGVRMQLRRSRTQSPDTREGYRGHLRKLASRPTLYRDHQPPDLGKYPHFCSKP